MLAGGINIQNIEQALQQHCLGIDLNSGVECANGIKDQIKLQTVLTKSKINKENMMGTILNPYFGEFGGMYVPEILVPVLKQLEKALLKLSTILCFSKNFKICLKIMQVVQQR